MSVIGTVYLLCFAEHGIPSSPGREARHYLGWTRLDAEDRLAQHLAGRGSPLVKAVVDRHGPNVVTLVRTWPGADRHYERALKRRREAPRLCPACYAAGRSRGLLHTHPPIRPLHRIRAGRWASHGGTIEFQRLCGKWHICDELVRDNNLGGYVYLRRWPTLREAVDAAARPLPPGLELA